MARIFSINSKQKRIDVLNRRRIPGLPVDIRFCVLLEGQSYRITRDGPYVCGPGEAGTKIIYQSDNMPKNRLSHDAKITLKFQVPVL